MTMNPKDYEGRLQDAAGKLASGKDLSTAAAEQVNIAARLLIRGDGPEAMEGYHNGDVVEAADHVENVLTQLQALKGQSRAAAKQARLVASGVDNVTYGIRTLYASVLEAGERERDRRASSQTPRRARRSSAEN